MKIQMKITLIVSIMLVLILGGVFLNLYTFVKMDSDTSFVNNAGRIRANSYRMAFLSNVISSEIQIGDVAAVEHEKTLAERISFVDKIIKGLKEGDTSLGLQQASNPEILRSCRC